MESPRDFPPLFQGEDKRPQCREDIEHWISVYTDLLAFARRHPVPHYVAQLEGRLSLWRSRQAQPQRAWIDVFARATSQREAWVLGARTARDRPAMPSARFRGQAAYQGQLPAA